MYPQEKRFTRKSIIAIILVLLALLVLSLLFIGTRDKQQGSISLRLETVPKDATVSINGEKIRGNTGKVEPGTYEFSAAKEGFQTTTKKVRVEESGQVVVILLYPESDSAKEWASKNQKLYLEAEAEEGKQAQATGERLRESNPIVAKLPYRSSYVNIDYARNENDQFVVRVTADTPMGRQLGLAQIRSWGYEPTDYTVVFVGLKNPFVRSTQ